MCAHSAIMVQRFRTNLCRWHYHLASTRRQPTTSLPYLLVSAECILIFRSHHWLLKDLKNIYCYSVLVNKKIKNKKKALVNLESTIAI